MIPMTTILSITTVFTTKNDYFDTRDVQQKLPFHH